MPLLLFCPTYYKPLLPQSALSLRPRPRTNHHPQHFRPAHPAVSRPLLKSPAPQGPTQTPNRPPSTTPHQGHRPASEQAQAHTYPNRTTSTRPLCKRDSRSQAVAPSGDTGTQSRHLAHTMAREGSTKRVEPPAPRVARHLLCPSLPGSPLPARPTCPPCRRPHRASPYRHHPESNPDSGHVGNFNYSGN